MIIRKTEELQTGSNGSQRVVIVGAGPVGIYIAAQLEDSSAEIVVIEAGDNYLGNFSPESFRSVGKLHKGIADGRSKSVGGASNLWGGQLVEFQPIDFQARPWMPSPDWPVQFDEIYPFYFETYEKLGYPGEYQKDSTVMEELIPTRPDFGSEIELFLTRWMKIPSFAKLFETVVYSSDKVKFLVQHTAVGFTYNGDRATGVKIHSKAGGHEIINADIVIVAAGTIETVRLLQVAQAESDNLCPWKDNQMLGKKFQDHLGIYAGTLTPKNNRKFYNIFANLAYKGNKFQPKVRYTANYYKEHDALNIQGSVSFDASVSNNLVFLKQFLKAAVSGRKIDGSGQFFKAFWGGIRYLPPLMWAYIVDHRVFVPSGGKIRLYLQCEQIPTDKSSLVLDWNTLDENSMPSVVLDWQVDGREITHIKSYAIQCKQLLESNDLATLEIDPAVLEQSPSVLEGARDTIHQSGGVIMGRNAAEGVVNRDLQVFGTSNVFVAGSCVFPTSSSANTTFTALTFATRLTKHIRARFGL
jgi:choline dehydrogenase-like flavoprotein